VDALAAGKRAAFAIDRDISEKKDQRPYKEQLESIYISMRPPGETVKQEMERPQKKLSTERIKDFSEVDFALDIESVKKECGRCLRCDIKVD
jgi:hypothetical protein